MNNTSLVSYTPYTKSMFAFIDATLESMWQASEERAPLQFGRRAYNIARANYIRRNRQAVELAVYSAK